MILTSGDNYRGIDEWLKGKKKVFLVCGDSINLLERLKKKLDTISIPLIRFSDFQLNPLYESVIKGVKLFRKEKCDSIIAVGGGSAMDVAKCIKLYSGFLGDGQKGEWLKDAIIPNTIPFLAIPTTAGTGSEATRYAVIYYNGIKQSVMSESIIPQAVLMDANLLKPLPLYQKKATMCDALCHALESFWSVNSTEESKRYSTEAIQGVMNHMNGYLNNTDEGNAGMLMAAHAAGKAINITQTTAGHAMCYKITSLFGCAHGHAAILCNRVLFSWMVENTDKCIDPRGEEYLKNALNALGRVMGCKNAKSGAAELINVFERLGLDIPTATAEQYEELKVSVNPVRLKNFPVQLNAESIDALYHVALK